jgi:hypothetical protein
VLHSVLAVLVELPPALTIAEEARSAVRGTFILMPLLRLLRFPDFVFVAVAPGLNSLGGNHVMAIVVEPVAEASGKYGGHTTSADPADASLLDDEPEVAATSSAVGTYTHTCGV